ncbi:hypothetical protein BURMUCGD2M_1644 [Burkholderia multivorans CGD2M]|uniref:Uncharacterized protein n=1 Tax=Burkholderia multivorans CGD2 TaxID=513052 RepID=B9C011_9BURK|nr:hypothetical protein BURMUCGD2_1549 [Burkholderia multivorans CGD2]EEE14702.1 hypothetical protein BURMUCGD2M_1644 [Burkholderia multivorans CGD2M]
MAARNHTAGARPHAGRKKSGTYVPPSRCAVEPRVALTLSATSCSC